MEYLTHRGIRLPKLGLGTWQVGADREKLDGETECFVEAYGRHGVFLFDTAEAYGGGASEKFVGALIKKIGRERLFIVDKILPQNATKSGFKKSADASLKRLGSDYIDLYLLHWRENAELKLVVDEMEDLKAKGKIGNWGVSNFDVSDMIELRLAGGVNCFADQILYNVGARGAEFDLFGYLKSVGVLAMAYSPLGSGLSDGNNAKARLKELCERTGASAEAVMLAFAIRPENLIAIFKTGTREHLEENLKCLDLDAERLMSEIDVIFPPPNKKTPLATI